MTVLHILNKTRLPTPRGLSILDGGLKIFNKTNKMKIWTSEHVFNHNWDAVVTSQFRKYPNPHNTAVLGTDVYDRRVDPETGILHSHRIITSGKLLPIV